MGAGLVLVASGTASNRLPAKRLTGWLCTFGEGTGVAGVDAEPLPLACRVVGGGATKGLGGWNWALQSLAGFLVGQMPWAPKPGCVAPAAPCGAQGSMPSGELVGWLVGQGLWQMSYSCRWPTKRDLRLIWRNAALGRLPTTASTDAPT